MTRTDHTRACNIYWEHLGLNRPGVSGGSIS
jgi:hypothetical protein